ncbi:hypothetical protein HanPSC8_Chr14g0621451 [Helianthus annuus]|nr:hypothetical protein HanPSC8_Chr14g0621451 [Helianthus annuus]
MARMSSSCFSIGSFIDFRVTLNRIPSFSSCLDKTRIIVAEFRTSSSTFSILSTKLTPEEPDFPNPKQTLLHCLLLITTPITIPTTNNTGCHNVTRFTNHPRTGF